METQNPYTVKKIKKITKTITVDEETDVIDWTKVPNGTFMTGKIKKTYVEGVLYKDKVEGELRLYFCQNEKDGAEAPFKFDFKYSWKFSQYPDGTHDSDVTDIQFPPKPADLVIPPVPPKPVKMMVGTYISEIHFDHIQVGCQKIDKKTILQVLAKMDKIAKSYKKTN